MAKRVLLHTRDLMFKAKLRDRVTAAGGEIVSDPAVCDIAVVEIEAREWESRIRELSGRGVAVLAFGSHVHADLLRTARDAGARAVPNSQVESVLGELLR